MNKCFYLGCLIIAYARLLGTASAETERDRSDWPTQEIKLSAQGTLADLFDSGIRPYRFPSLESVLLECKHINAIVVQPNGTKLPVYAAALIHIDVESGGLLAAMEFQNQKRTLADCRTEMLRWLHLGNRPSRTVEELDEFLKSVAADPENYDNVVSGITHDFSIHWRDDAEIRYVIWFHKCRDPAKPLAVYMKIGFPRLPRPARFYTGPIPPPPGYEDVDMTAPKNFGPDSPPPDPERERVRNAGVMPDYSKLPKEKPRPLVLPPGHEDAKPHPQLKNIASTAPVSSKSTTQESQSIWLWVSAAVAVLLALVLMIKRRS